MTESREERRRNGRTYQLSERMRREKIEKRKNIRPERENEDRENSKKNIPAKTE